MTSTPRALLAAALLGAAAFPALAQAAPDEPEGSESQAEAQPGAQPEREDRSDRRERGVTPEIAAEMERRKLRRSERDDGAADAEPYANLLEDPGFEGHLRWDEGQPWWNPLKVQNSRAWVEFDVTDEVARSGERAAHLHMDSDTQPGPTRVHGVVQEPTPGRMPRYLSGWYRVDNWQRGTLKQYIQAVVIARNPSNPPASMPRGRANTSVQLAMTLAGVDFPPLEMGNRKFEVTGPVEPAEGEWVFFEFDLHELYERHWGAVPENAEGTRVFFEVRYDGRTGGPAAKADVYFDDLYLGDEPQAPDESQAP